MQSNLMLSSLAHTWIFDVDGTICIHNGYKNGEDVLLGGVKEFFSKILVNDDKPSGLKCAYAINKRRDEKLDIKFKIDRDL